MDNKKADKAIDKDIIKSVAKSAGWMSFKAKKKLTEAQELGISPNKYLEKECWKMSEEELNDYAEKLRASRELHRERVTQLVDAGGLSRQYASEKIRTARKLGITFKQLMDRSGYDLEDEDLERLAKALKAVKRRRADQRSYILDLLVERSGWTRTSIVKSLKAASEKEINIFNYFVNACWTMDDKQMDDLAKIYIERRSEVPDKRDQCIEYISSCTGWSDGLIELEILETIASSGCSYEDFARCHMWELTLEERGKFIGGDVFRRLRFDNNDFVVGSPIFDYKNAFEEKFDSLISRRHFEFNDEMPKDVFFKKIDGLSSIVVKPDRGSYGNGIEILACNESYLKNGELYDYLKGIGKPLVIEEKIKQCDVLEELSPTSVNTLRIVTLRHDDETHVLQCVLRCGVGEVVDNIHSGGLVVEVDRETGVCKGDAVDYFGNLIEKHPITGVSFKGLQVPNIADAITLAQEASKVVPECKLIGWDIAITQNGADLVEGNLKADYDAGQMAHLGVAWEGLRETVVAPYMNSNVANHSYLEDLEQEAEDAELIDEAKFKFTVVMPVYKAEEYLHEAVDSLINQTIGFEENIQLVLVNDGSPDDSASICEEYANQYPDNIVFVDKENGGPSSARNAGIPHVEGAFVNFLDSDDKWEKDAFGNVWKLIEEHKGEIDVVGCRQKFFEGRSGYQRLDYKFQDGDRVIDIKELPDYVQLSATSAFIAASALKEHTFDERISVGDDSKLLIEVVLDKCRYGVCSSAIHHFRKREDSSSITQSKNSDKKAFIDTIQHYYSFIADYSVAKYGRIIPYIQHCLVNGLKYRASNPVPGILSESEGDEYRSEVVRLIGLLSDGVLLEARNANPSLKLYMLHLKNNAPIQLIATIKDGEVWVNGGEAFEITGSGDVRLENLRHDEDEYYIEGIVRIPGFVRTFALYSDIADNIAEIALPDDISENRIGISGEVISTKKPFIFDLPENETGFDLRMLVAYNDDKIEAPISVSKDGNLPRVNKGDVSIGEYLVSRPEKKVLSLKKEA